MIVLKRPNPAKALRLLREVSGKLGAHPQARRRMLVGGILLYMTKPFCEFPRGFRADVRALNTILQISLFSFSDYRTLREIFLRNDYALSGRLKAKVILDLGSNVGYSIHYLRLLFPSARIWGIEADPENFLKLTRNTSSLQSVQLLNLAASNSDGVELLYSKRGHRTSSSLVLRGQQFKAVQVRSSTLSSILSSQSLDTVDLVKFDVEGAESRIFRNSEAIHRVNHFIGEFHSNLTDCSLQEFQSFFPGFVSRIRYTAPDRAIVTFDRVP